MVRQNDKSLHCAVILTALRDEYMAVRAHLVDLCEETLPQGNVCERGTFSSGGQTWNVGIVEIGPGNISAAQETERAIAHFKPDVALFVGVAGGVKDVEIGDVVVATKVYGYESGKAGEDFLTRPVVGNSTFRMVQRARAEARKNDWVRRLGAPGPRLRPRVFVGPIAAGEKLVASTRSAVFEFLRAHYNDALAIEMEGGGFLQATHANQEVNALIIRGISDRIDGKTEADSAGSQTTASQHASAFAFEVLAKFGTTQGEQAGSSAAEVAETQDADQQGPIVSLRFTNRRDELSLLNNPKAVQQYLVIDAPAEYGKTTLIEALIHQYQASPNCWKCIYHKMSASETPTSLMNSVYRDLVNANEDLIDNGSPLEDGIDHLVSRIIEYVPEPYNENWGISIVFDNFEQLAEFYQPTPDSPIIMKAGKTATWIIKTFVPNLMDQLQRSGFLTKHDVKFIFSGRYIANMVQSVSGRLTISVQSLRPFDWNTVQEAIEGASRELRFPPDKSAIVGHTAQLMYYTGGHPGYLVHLLTEAVSSKFGPDPAKFYQSRIDRFYEMYISATIEQIRKAFRAVGGSEGDQLVDALDTLAVFRRFDAAMIKELQGLGKLEWALSPWELIAKLGPLHILTLDRGYYKDAITRRLLVIRLRHKHPDRFIGICQTAAKIYEGRLKSDKRQKEPILLFTEWLYQEAQLAAVDQQRKDQLRTILLSEEILHRISRTISNLDEYEDPTERLNSLISEIVSDDELKFMLDFALNAGVGDSAFDPVSKLTDAIEAVIQERKTS